MCTSGHGLCSYAHLGGFALRALLPLIPPCLRLVINYYISVIGPLTAKVRP